MLISDNSRGQDTKLQKLLAPCTALHFSQCTLEPCETQHCTAEEILQRRQNNCCLELKKPLCGRVAGMDSRAGEAQADSDVWWMLHSHRAHRDLGLFVATNGIVHIFYCNPWLKPRNWGSLCVTGHQSFWYAHRQWGLTHCHTTKG